MAADSPIQPGALEYSRSVFNYLMDWYNVADAKGRLLLTLNGIYITVLSSVALASPHDLINHKATLTPAAWILLAGAAAATAISILSAIGCLYSRLSNADLDKYLGRFAERDPAAASPYRPAATCLLNTHGLTRAGRPPGRASSSCSPRRSPLSLPEPCRRTPSPRRAARHS